MSRIPANDVLVFGMNKFTHREAKAIDTKAIDVKVVHDTKVNDQIKVGRNTYDLTTPTGREDFVKTLGLPKSQSDEIVKILARSGPDTRDELAQLAQIWAEGEKGGKVPGRMVLSGHSVGDVLWGEEGKGKSKFENGWLSRDDFTALAKAMPKAAAQVQDIAISACFCGGEDNLNKWKEGFPNAKTVTAYDGFSPSGKNAGGSQKSLQRWEKLTRGDVEALKPEQFKGTAKWKDMATWSVKHGYLRAGGQEKPAIVQARIDAFKKDERADFMSGKKTSATALRAYYTDLQNLAARPTTSAADKAALQEEIGVMLRLRHHEGVNTKFQKNNKAELTAGYDALGLKAPNFSKLSRAETVKAIDEFAAAVAKLGASAPAEAQKALALLNALKVLDPKTIDAA